MKQLGSTTKRVHWPARYKVRSRVSLEVFVQMVNITFKRVYTINWRRL
jgi:hypothetical protein